jgi:tRNA dimethylallyltransferase
MTGPPVVALVGPTAAGKSAVALAAAEATGAVVVAVDAFTVYRQMTVGTAKPTAAERARVPHRMVDVLDVEEACTVRWFQQAARAAVDAARSAGRPVLLVGGSGLYLRAVVDPLEFPPTDPAVRARLAAEVEADPVAAHAHLAAVDPEGAARIDPRNARRTTRALEVAELTGRPFSSYAVAWERWTPVWDGLVVIGLRVDPAALADRIAARVDAMLAAGWLEECRALLERHLSATAAQAIGYAELLAHLRTGGPPLAEVAEAITARTRRFAARQRRWFAGDPRIAWIDPGAAAERLVAALEGRADPPAEDRPTA